MIRLTVLSLIFTILYLTPINSQYSIAYGSNGDPNYLYENTWTNGNYIEVSAEESVFIPLPFAFDFFGESYNGIYVYMNGLISFIDDISNCCAISAMPNNALPNGVIANFWVDPSVITPWWDDCYDEDLDEFFNCNWYSWQVFGEAPNRRFILSKEIAVDNWWGYYYGQIKLFEGTNIIEFHATDVFTNGNPATMGIESPDGNTAIVVPGRNNQVFPASWWDFVRFTPFQEGVSASILNIRDRYCEGLQQIEFTIQNFGTEPINSVEVKWIWDNIEQSDILFDNLDLAVGQILTLYLPEKEIQSSHSVEIEIYRVNGEENSEEAESELSTEVSVALEGIYTVGGSSPDFNTLQQAIDSLQTSGVCGPVFIEIRPGTYTGQTTIGTIPGADDLNPVIIRSENQDSTSVILTHNSTSFDNNFTIRFTGSSGVQLSHLTIAATNTSNGKVIHFASASEGIKINNCIINGVTTTGTSTNLAAIHFDNNVIIFFDSDEESFLNGSNASQGQGSGPDHYSNIDISNNIFNNASFGIYSNSLPNSLFTVQYNIFNNATRAIHFNNINQTEISFNQINATKNAAQGIILFSSDYNNVISNNKFDLSAGSIGIDLSGGGYNIFNNMISIGGTQANRFGIRAPIFSQGNFWFNTVNIYGSGTNSTCLQADPQDAKNNILSNFSGGRSISLINNTNCSNHNNLFTTGDVLCSTGTGGSAINYNTLSDWQSGTNNDINSWNLNPQFNSNTDLYSSNTVLKAKGITIPFLDTDIDGNPRNPNIPDIGAANIEGFANDMALIKRVPALECSSPDDIYIMALNLGENEIENFTINWEINGIEVGPTLYEDQIDIPGGIGSDSLIFKLPTYAFTPGQLYQLKVWSFLPNGSADQNPTNDTIVFDFMLPLEGTFTISGISPDFLKLSDAVNALKSFGMCGDVQLNIRSGAFEDRVNISNIPGLSEAHSLTIESESGNAEDTEIFITTGSAQNNFIIYLEGMYNINIKNLTLRTNGSTFNHGIVLGGNVENLLIEGCVFNCPQGVTSQSGIFSAFGVHNLSNITISNNQFSGGNRGILLSNFGNDLPPNTNLQINGNTFNGQRLGAADINKFENIIFSNNTVQTGNTNLAYNSLRIDGNTGQTEIFNNQFFTYNGSILIQNANGTQDTVALFNNFISSTVSNSLLIANSSNIGVYFNNIYSGGTFNNIAAINIINSAENVHLFNNNAVSENHGVLRLSSVELDEIYSDHNNFYTKNGYLAIVNNVQISTLSDWQNESNKDQNSLSEDPEYYSQSNFRIYNSNLYQAGMTITGIETDIDGNERDSASPTIGAHELATNVNDAGIISGWPQMPFARGNQEIVAVLRNFGAQALENVQIYYSINDSIAPAFAYTEELAPLAQDTVVIGIHSFQLNEAVNLKMWTEMPNGLPDQFTGNDSITIANLYPALSDTILVGTGSGYDLSTLPDVINAAKSGGILDTTYVLIQAGTYSLSWLIDAHENFSCNTPIIFESESGDSTAVVINNLSAGNNTLILNGAKGIHFKRLTFATTSNVGTQGRVIVLSNNCECISIESCVIQGWIANSTSNNFSNIFFNSGSVTGFTLKNSLILNGNYGLHTNSLCHNIQVVNNQLKNQYYSGCYFLNSHNNFFYKNLIETNNPIPNNFFRGLWASGARDSLRIEKNDFNLPGLRAHAVQLDASTQVAFALVANNFIQVGINSGTASSYGIFFTTVPGLKIIHNTIKHVGHTGITSACISSSENSSVNVYEIKNNIFFHQNGGPSIYTSPTNIQNPNINTDYNLLYTPGSALVRRGSTNYSDLAAWQATGKDSNSISEFIVFKDSMDLHVSSAFLNGTATPHPLVTDDIDDDPRDPIAPDIGADEFDLVTNDVAILAISYPNNPFPVGTNPVFIRFANNGDDTLTVMTVDWEVNGEAQPTYLWTGILPSGATYDSLEIGMFTFDYATAYDIKVWLSMPNGMPDELNSNDTLHIFNLISGLSGDYTVGGEESDFENLEEAILALNSGGAAGNVRFLLRPGIYTGVHEIEDFVGASCERTVRIEPESGDLGTVTISNLGFSNHTIVFSGCKGVILDRLIIESVNPSFRHVLHLLNSASCNQVINCDLRGLTTTSTSSAHSVILFDNSQNLINEFYDNIIQGGSFGFYLGTSSGIYNTKIHRNHIQNYYFNGIYGSQHNGLSIRNSFIESTPSNASQVFGIRLANLTGYFEIIANDINNTQANNGLSISSCNGTSDNKSLIANNFIKSGGNSNTIGNGLLITGSSHIQLLHNSISSRPSNTSHRNQISTSSHIELFNNIFAIYTSGTALRFNNNTNISSNHNVYYTTDNIILENGSETYTLLADWINDSGQDENSLTTNPQFVSESDLHVTATLLKEAGLYFPQVSHDIDGDVRNNPPDIGADEFELLPTDDAGIMALKFPVVPFASGEQMVKVVLKNYGGNPLQSTTIRWIVNGMEQNEYEWSGNLAPAQCDTIHIGNYIFQPHTLHQLLIWTELPNGMPDTTTTNDSLFIDMLYPALSGQYTIGGFAPDFNLIAQAMTALSFGGILDDVTFLLRNGTYQRNITVGDFPRQNEGHKVTFRSQSGNKNNVEWRNDLANNYLIRLNGTKNIHFEEIDFKVTSGGIFNIAQGSHDIHIENCRLEGMVSNTASNRDARALIYSTSSVENNIKIIGNELINGSYGIYLYGSSGVNETGTEIRDNILSGPMHQAVNISRQEGLIYENNHTVSSSNSNTTNHNFSFCSGSFTINRNRFNGQHNPVTLSYCILNADDQGYFTNNWIGNGLNNISGNGLSLNYSQRVHVDHNTVHMWTNESWSALNITSGSNLKIRNNNIINSGQGRTVTMSTVTPTFDFNNLYTNGPIFGRSNSVNRITFADFQSASNTNLSSINADPLFVSNDAPDASNPQLNNNGIVLSFPDTDYYGTTRSETFADIGAVEFNPPLKDAGIPKIVSPVSGCGLNDELPVIVRIFNYGIEQINELAVEFSLDGQSWVSENLSNLNIASGQYYDHEFTQTIDFSQLGTYQFWSRTVLIADENNDNDLYYNGNIENLPAMVSGVGNMIPTNGTTGLQSTVSFSWSPAQNAVLYDLYVWLQSDTKPATPNRANLSGINTSVSNLAFGQTYLWQVTAKNICGDEIDGPVHSFSVRQLPDLVVENIVVPVSAFSGQNITIEWIIKNDGLGSTQNALWTDAVYLSVDATFNQSLDFYLGGVGNLTALNPGESYTNTSTFTLPNGIDGDFYIFVRADRFNNVLESNENNNIALSGGTVEINLIPPPDLRVTDVGVPVLSFSGQAINISYTVRNFGQGGTLSNQWRDRIFIVNAPNNPNTLLSTLKTITRNGALEPDSSYTVFTEVNIPNNIEGSYIIRLHTDVLNEVYEFVFDNNNTEDSDPINILRTPPPDLVIHSLEFPDSVSINESFPITWKTVNQGSSDVINLWRDAVYFSISPVFNINFMNTLVTKSSGPILEPGDTITTTRNVRINGNFQGEYNMYAFADDRNQVAEYEFENNNIFKSNKKLKIVTPDLFVGNCAIPDSIMEGTQLSLNYHIRNIGSGNLVNRSFRQRIYMSDDMHFNQNTDVLLITQNLNNRTILSGDSLAVSTIINIPFAMPGTKHIIIVSDFDNQIFESNEQNNVYVSANTLYVYEAPYPDLVTENVSVPAEAHAGSFISLNYILSNIGDTLSQFGGRDSIFISFDAEWNRANATFIAHFDNIFPISPDIPVQIDRNVLIPYGQNSNIYYVYVVCDARDQIYEGVMGELNNVSRSNSFVVLDYPDVDLAVADIVLETQELFSGMSYEMQYEITNLGDTTTFFASWQDRVYLSIDSIFSPSNDILVSTINYSQGKISLAEIKTQSASIQIPNGLSGEYYLYVQSDFANINNDVDLTNNYNRQRIGANDGKVDITLSQYPNLRTVNAVTPVTITSGSSTPIVWITENAGEGNASPRTDNLYISSIPNISSGALLLSSKRLPALSAAQSNTDTINIVIPPSYVGNYFLIFSVDHRNDVYEYDKEGDNITILATEVLTPEPADLIVENIIVPDQVIAGETGVFSWTTRNIGSNPAIGLLRDIAYISPNTNWELSDVLLHVIDRQIYLPPQQSITTEVTTKVNGVADGDYHIIVRTDARNNIPETNENNNFSTSIDQMNVSIKEIFMDVEEEDILVNNENLYFKIFVNPEYEGRNMLFKLKSEAETAFNEVYIKYAEIPTPANADFIYQRAFSQNQDLKVRNLQPGYYYIMIKGMNPAENSQDVEVLAEILLMEILEISPDRGGNKGFVTVFIRGSELDSVEYVNLVLDDTTQYYNILAHSFIIESEELIIARFDLRDKLIGTYHVECVAPDGTMAYRPNGFEIIEGIGARLHVQWDITPRSFRSGRPPLVQIMVSYGNSGDADVENQTINLSTADLSNPVFMSLDDYYNNLINYQLDFPAQDRNGLEGILRPGGLRTVFLYGIPIGIPGFELKY